MESEYGRSIPVDIETGKKSKNLFGIKATKSDIKNNMYVSCVTHEEINGTRIKIVDKFRAYNSYDDSLEHHAKLLRNNYKPKNTASKRKKNIKKWAKSLQKKGYATDSDYAEKLESIIFYTWYLK